MSELQFSSGKRELLEKCVCWARKMVPRRKMSLLVGRSFTPPRREEHSAAESQPELVLNCTISRYAEKRQRTAALQDAAALSEAPRPAGRLWSATGPCRCSIVPQRTQA